MPTFPNLLVSNNVFMQSNFLRIVTMESNTKFTIKVPGFAIYLFVFFLTKCLLELFKVLFINFYISIHSPEPTQKAVGPDIYRDCLDLPKSIYRMFQMSNFMLIFSFQLLKDKKIE